MDLDGMSMLSSEEEDSHLLSANGISSEYAGQVQTLVDMFEKFAMKCELELVDNGTKPLATTTTTSKDTLEGTATSSPILVNSPMEANEDRSSSPTPSGTEDDSLSTVGETLSSLETRITTLETKVRATVTFKTDKLLNKIDVIGQANISEEKVQEKLSSVKATTKMIVHDCKFVGDNVEDVLTRLKKENAALKEKVAMLEKMKISGKEIIKLRLTHLESCLSQMTSYVQHLLEIMAEIARSQ